VDDPAVVAAIAAGELDGLAAALDRYAAALYDYCYAMVPAVAAEAVRDTFVIAWSSMDRLRDPAKLYPWLQAVAGNECFRQALTGGPAAAPADAAPEPTLPSDLPGQVLGACADNTSAGQAYRVSVTYRAGPFDHDGFPKVGSRPRARRRRLPGGLPERLRERRRPVATVAALAAVAVLAAALAAASTVLTGPSSSPRHGRAAAGAAPVSGAAPAAGAAPVSGAGLPTTPARPIPSPGTGRSSPGARAPGGAQPPGSPVAADGALPPATAGPPPAGTLAKPPVVPMATVMPGPRPTATAVRGVLSVDPDQLHFVSVRGRDSTRTFVITAKDGPVTGYTIAVPPGLPGSLTVSPSSGSLPEGGSVTITVTAASTVPFVTSLTVRPGGAVIAVDVKANP
jgi:hypothetical protein